MVISLFIFLVLRCFFLSINYLLKGHYFTAVDLADLGRQLDFAERGHLLKEDLGEVCDQ